MVEPKEESLQFEPRYWRNNAERAIRDVYDALVELVTNADDSYARLGSKSGRIEIEVERKRKDVPSVIRVRDFAEGMTLQVMREKLLKVGGRVSGMEKGVGVRGTFSRGAKDVAILGEVVFESVASDEYYHKCKITKQCKFFAYESCPKDDSIFAAHIGIQDGTGTLASIFVDPHSRYRIPQHETLRQELGRLVVLRDILKSPTRDIVLTDIRSGRTDGITFREVDCKERLNERFAIPGYPGAEAKLLIMRAREPFDNERPRFRLGGILVKSKHAIHEATLFDGELERDPHAKWFCGRLVCEHIEYLLNEYENRYERGVPADATNPCAIVDTMRKEGLVREHPFVDALFKEALKRLRPLVEEERKQADSKQAKVESEATRKRLKALERAAAKFMSENREEEDADRGGGERIPESAFGKKGYALSPPFVQIIVGQSAKFSISIKRDVFPELSVGESVNVSCTSSEISSSRTYGVLESHPGQEGVLRCLWNVKGEKPTKTTGVKVRVGPILENSLVEVFASEKDRYADITRFCFGKKRYSVHNGGTKTVFLYAPCPALVSERTPIEVQCSEKLLKITGAKFLEPRPELGVAICKLRLTVQSTLTSGVIRASIPGHNCECEVVSTEPFGAPIRIELKDVDYTNNRYRWRENALEIATRHKSLKRYLGGPPNFTGQEQTHFRVLLAEIVAEAVCYKMVERNEKEKPEEYGERDWPAYYSAYEALMTKFLPVAHETQVGSV